jgi:protein-S-isoprenylcysteine O-methyltransferase Ste14
MKLIRQNTPEPLNETKYMINLGALERRRIPLSRILGAGVLLLFVFSGSYWEGKGLISTALFFIGVILVGVATMGRVWCSLYISGYKTQMLITVGPYSMCRNPLYFFSLLGLLGAGLTTETLGIPTILLAGFALYYPLVIRAEEEKLLARHGKDFEAYCQRTPRFFPSPSLLSEPKDYTVKVEVFKKSLLDALWFIWITGIFEILESLHENGVIPMPLTLY